MICALLCAMAIAKPIVVEVPDASGNAIDVDVLVKLPDLDARELAMARILTGMMLDGTEELTSDQLRLWTSTGGQSIRCTLAPDHLRIGFAVAKGDLATAGLIVESLCRRATLGGDSFDSIFESLRHRVYPYWTEALDPRVPRFERIHLADVQGFYAHIFRPENIVVAVGGPFSPGSAKVEIESRFEGWTPDRDTYPRFHYFDSAGLQDKRGRSITTVELACPEVAVGSPGFAQALLAVTALGVGKGSAVFQVAREAMSLSYKQDALLWPGPTGMMPRVIVTFASKSDEASVPKALREGLMKVVSSWGPAELERAKAMLRAALLDGTVPGPIWLSPERPLGPSQADRTLLAGYWRLKATTSFDWGKLEAAVNAVTADELKAAATTMLTSATPVMIAGR